MRRKTDFALADDGREALPGRLDGAALGGRGVLDAKLCKQNATLLRYKDTDSANLNHEKCKPQALVCGSVDISQKS